MKLADEFHLRRVGLTPLSSRANDNDERERCGRYEYACHDLGELEAGSTK